MRIALGLEYDGSAFCGWQTQPSACGVQDHLESALERFADTPIEVTAAGRTDTGVHATAQVVHFDTEVVRDGNAWVRGTNACANEALRILWSHPVAADFHARYSALSRTYRYLLLNDPVAPAILRNRVGWFHRPLDVERMREGAKALVGEHDFSAFRGSQCQSRSPIRNVMEVGIEREANIVAFTFRANAFLHHMIRNLMGCLVAVGQGLHDPDWMREVLLAKSRDAAAPTFSPDGLYFLGPVYESHWGLPSRTPAYAWLP